MFWVDFELAKGLVWFAKSGFELKVEFWVSLGEKAGFGGFGQKFEFAAFELISPSLIRRLVSKWGVYKVCIRDFKRCMYFERKRH